MRSWEFSDPVYGAPIVLLSGPFSRLNPFLLRRFGTELSPTSNHDSVAKCMVWTRDADSRKPGPPKFFVIWLGPTTGLYTVMHECLHATHRILVYFDVELSYSNDEAEAYYFCWLMREVVKRLGISTLL